MWRPERSAHGPFAVGEKDISGLNRLFADSFTDRYRRDGLVGVRVPFLNEAIWRFAIADAGDGAQLWRDESDRLVAFNIAHRSGTEGWMGPLCVRPDRQLGGLGREIVMSAVDWLKGHGVTTLGLETMPRTVDNIGFYSRLGFVPGNLTLTMTADTSLARGRRSGGGPAALGQMTAADRTARLAEIRGLVHRLAPGYDFTRELEISLDLGLGDVLTLDRDGALAGFALVHAAPLAEGGGREEVRALKLGAVDLPALLAMLDGAAAWAGRLAVRRLAVRCQTAYTEAYRALVARGFRVRWSDLRMTLTGYPEAQPAGEGILWSNWEI